MSASLLKVSGVAMALLMSVAACSSSDDADGASGSSQTSPAVAPTAVAEPTQTALPQAAVVEPTQTALPQAAGVEPTVGFPPPLPIAPPEPIAIEAPEGMELAWSDEFDGDEIDPANWTHDIGGWGWGNGEAQYYTDRPENARVQDGLLVIELRQERFEDSHFTSARLKTQGLQEFQYGRIEARIKVPKGSGTWPAFWMLGSAFDQESDDPSKQWPNVGEIDIMEYVGREPDLVLGTVHGPGYSGAGGRSRWNRQEYDIGDDFHTFAIDWDESGIRWFYDDEMYYELGPVDLGDREWVFDQPFFVILNLALGGTLGGTMAQDLEFPIQYYVDYVRVYQPAADPNG